MPEAIPDRLKAQHEAETGARLPAHGTADPLVTYSETHTKNPSQETALKFHRL